MRRDIFVDAADDLAVAAVSDSEERADSRIVDRHELGGDVHVITRRTLRTFLMQQPLRLTPSQVEHIFAVARNSGAWQPT